MIFLKDFFSLSEYAFNFLPLLSFLQFLHFSFGTKPLLACYEIVNFTLKVPISYKKIIWFPYCFLDYFVFFWVDSSARLEPTLKVREYAQQTIVSFHFALPRIKLIWWFHLKIDLEIVLDDIFS